MTAIEAHRGKATIRIEDDPEGKERPAMVNYIVEQDDVWSGDQIVGGMKSWKGEFQASPFPVSLQFAELVLEDGRRGRIFIDSIEYVDVTNMGDEWQAVAGTASGSFVGCGAAPS